METQRSPLLNWPYYYQGKSMEDLENALTCTRIELEKTRLAAQEEIRMREEQLTHLQELLSKTISERDEAQHSYKALLLEKLLFQQQQQHHQQPQQQQLVHSRSSSSGVEDENTSTKKPIDSNTNNNVGGNHSSSDGEESIISSPPSPPPAPPLPSALPEYAMKLISGKKPLPEKGKLLQAVIKAGPLLQTLLLAGPLPQWRHPPPPLENFDIPPVTIPASTTVNQPDIIITANHHQQEFFVNNGYDNCGVVNRKRGYSYGLCDDSSYEANKYQRVLLH